MSKKPLTAEQLYQREYWRKNKKHITKNRKTVLKKHMATYQKAYRKKHLKAYKKYQKAYRKKYYHMTGR